MPRARKDPVLGRERRCGRGEGFWGVLVSHGVKVDDAIPLGGMAEPKSWDCAICVHAIVFDSGRGCNLLALEAK